MAAAGVAVLALTGGQLLMASQAQAVAPSAVWIEAGTLRFQDVSNVQNNVTLALVGSSYELTDSLGNVSAQWPCAAVSAHRVRCPAGSVSRYSFSFLAGNDRLVNTTKLPGYAFGGTGHDLLIGGFGAEILSGEAGNDSVMGRLGNDRLYGGTGIDWVRYDDRSAPVRVRLDNTVADDGQPNIGEKDLVWPDIENANGGASNDLLVGSNGSNWLAGLGGNDSIFGQGGNDRLTPDLGKDRVYGGTGAYDYIDYTTRTVAVRVTLHDGTANEGQTGEGDYADAGVEGILGGQSSDYLVGNNGNNVIQGAAGNDRIYALGGNDSLYGGLGSDYGNGGLGSDFCSSVESKVSCP